jgi:hypothetical protein
VPRVHRATLLLLFPLALLALLAPPRALADPATKASAPADSAAVLPPPRVRAWQLGLARPDRLQHASLSFALAAAATLASGRPRASFAGALALGLAKELWDAHVTAFDPADLAADAAGAALGASGARAGGR